jgi:predicted metal-dependent hydrolase
MRSAARGEAGRTKLKTHPHAGATYRVIVFADGSFGVEVSIPNSEPTTVSRFVTEADAEAWIAEHRQRVQEQAQPGGWFRNSARRRARS